MAKLGSCHGTGAKKSRKKGEGKTLTIALAGNANVGKSVIFNQLTGSHQTIGNWPGKTVESARGFLDFEGEEIAIIDLPGIYSLSTFSLEEIVTRDYIAREKPDVIINVIGAPVLERNLFFTLQLMEMDVPMVVDLNQVDLAEAQGITIDAAKLAKWLDVPVVPTIAARGTGIRELVSRAVEVARGGSVTEDNHIIRDARSETITTGTGHQNRRWNRQNRQNGGPNGIPGNCNATGTGNGHHRHRVRYQGGLEAGVSELTDLIESEKLNLEYPPRWVAVKLLEGDTGIKEMVGAKSEHISRTTEVVARRLEETYKQPRFAAVASERYALAQQIARDVQSQTKNRTTFLDRLDRLTTQKVFGYVMSVVVIAGLLLWTFTIGNILSTVLTNAFSFFQPVNPQVSGQAWSIVWNGVFGGFVAGVTLVLPFVIPFYLMLAVMEDSGILTRVAFMMDSAMHQMGLHGKAIIPLILGYGCNVPAIYTTRVMGTRRERLLASFAITFAPCAARTIVILGLVSVFVGYGWALALYAIDLLIMFIAVKVALKVIPGDTPGLIMEMHSFKTPSLSVVTRQTWARTKSLIIMVLPMYMIGTAAVQGLYAFGILQPVSEFMSPLTVSWLGLPVVAGILLVFGVVRKELILLALVAIYGTDLAAVLTPAQFIVLALVGMLYLPCIATIGILAKEFGWKSSIAISLANLAAALLAGGIAARILDIVF
ncbi:MAG: ferrous iron transport protein B [Chloroflexi bacterium RBG_16_56_11]|nr:MAG: ferrous iron transport protein B [Chloroflexi bacterium RBG_16_56_11]